MARLVTEINRVLPDDSYLVADGGFAAHWGLLFDTKRAGRHFVPDRGFASIGYGLPGAMGVAMAAPGKMVFSLTGDGGFNMMLDEIETARRLRLTFTVIVVNNAASGYVKALQPSLWSGFLSRLRSGGDRLCRGGTGSRLQRHSGRRTRSARRRAETSHVAEGTDSRRRRGHARPGKDVARGRQPGRSNQERRSGGVTARSLHPGAPDFRFWHQSRPRTRPCRGWQSIYCRSKAPRGGAEFLPARH
jgi:hypothetical protein